MRPFRAALNVFTVAWQIGLAYRKLTSPAIIKIGARALRIETLAWALWRQGHALESIEAFSIAAAIRLTLMERLGLSHIYVLPDVCMFSIGCLGFLDHYLKYDILTKSKRYYLCLQDPKKFVNPFLLEQFVIRSGFKVIVVRNECIRLFLRRILKSICLPIDWVIPMNRVPVYLPTATIAIQRSWEEQRRRPLLDRGKLVTDHADKLSNVGIDRPYEHACLHARESGYHPGETPAQEAFRNADIATYGRAVCEMQAHGLRVVRMGDPSMSDIPALTGVLDYAHSTERSGLMDCLLIASSRCYLGCSSGLLRIAQIFGVPTAVTNYIPIALATINEDDLCCPKKLFSNTADRELSLSEMLSRPVSLMLHYTAYEASHLTFVDNTPEQLRDVARELCALGATGSLPKATLDQNSALQYANLAGGKLSSAFLNAIDVVSPARLEDLDLQLTAIDHDVLVRTSKTHSDQEMADDLNEARQFAHSLMGHDVPTHDPYHRDGLL
jgi:putative glycosyltransferase (TIGR04372 family)